MPHNRLQFKDEPKGQKAIEQVSQGHIDAAFIRAQALVRPGDEAAVERLGAQKQVAMESRSRLGIVRGFSTPDEMYFAGCLTRSYFVRYVGGQQRWLLKFRRGAQGWYLTDLDVRAS